MVRTWFAVAACFCVVGCGREIAERRAEREAAEAEAGYAAYKARDAEAEAERQGQMGAVEEQERARVAEAKAREKEERAAREPERVRLEALTKEAEALTPAERAAKVRALCSPQRCQEDDARAVAKAAKTPAERTALDRPIDAVREAAEAKARERVADAYEETLLRRRMNPDSVRAGGAGKKTLIVRGFFCTRQHLYDLDHSEEVKALRAAGFTRIECSNGFETWTGGL